MTIQLVPGDSVPHFRGVALGGAKDYVFDSVAGRPVVMLFHGSFAWPSCASAAALLKARRAVFDDVHACFFGITVDQGDVVEGRIAQSLPGIRWFLDFDRAISRAYGAVHDEPRPRYEPHWLLLDSRLRVVLRRGIADGAEIFAALDRLQEEERATQPAPVLIVPRVLDPATCRALIDTHNMIGGTESGFMREENGVTVHKLDHQFKRRRDCLVPDGDLLQQVRAQLRRSLFPQIKAAFQFEPTRVERWLVACYDDRDGGGFFRAHRDNSTKGTAHRKFACTINLNAGDYDGGDLTFPEFGNATYRAPTGGAAIFSCSLLHAARAVTRGTRYALLPFFYDDAGARLREINTAFVTGELKGYRSGLLN
jgi:predicted 2-oxoglutarate/Fe(II)-dependent dioxygenase YbiX/peroxiredoxin